MTAFVVAEGLSFAIRGRLLVRDVSIRLESGLVAAIVGPNGAGKSTFLKLLTGELAPSAGDVAYDGRRLASMEPWRLACMRAVMAQSAGVAFPFTVHETVRLGLDGIGRGLGRLDRERIVGEALADGDVLHLAGRPIQTLSGGERQRVNFARALSQLRAGRTVAERQALFLDEPVASLDLKHQLALMAAARRLAREGVAVLVVLHDLNLALTFADRLLVLQDGAAAAEGPPRQALTRERVAEVFEADVLRPGRTADEPPSVLPQHADEPRPGPDLRKAG